MALKIRLSNVIKESIVDGPGFRYTLFLQGCLFNCFNCHNLQTHDMSGGYCEDMDDLIKDINSTKHIRGVTFSGGEPFLQVSECLYVAKRLDKKLNIICYTGYTFEQLLTLSQENNDILSFLESINYLIDGKYIDSLRSYELKYKGSKNQRIIDVKKSLEEKHIVLANL